MTETIIFGFLSALSLLFTWYFGKLSNDLVRQQKSLTWNQLHLVAEATCFNLKRNNFEPDIILAPGPRGAILAELILGKFNRAMPALVGISLKDSSASSMPTINDFISIAINQEWNIYIPSPLRDFYDKNVLIVDDFCLTGAFFDNLKSEMLRMGFNADKIKVFCAVITKVAQNGHRTPDYYHLVTEDDDFEFPWGKANTG